MKPARTLALGAALGAAVGSVSVWLPPPGPWQVRRFEAGVAATFAGALVGVLGGAIVAKWGGR